MWNKETFNGLNSTHVQADKMWTPDVYLYNK